MLFEIGEPGRQLRELRARLGLDSGYLARLLRSLEAGSRGRSCGPGRPPLSSRSAHVAGPAEVHALDARSDRFAQELPRRSPAPNAPGSSRRWGRSTDCCARQRSSSIRSIPVAPTRGAACWRTRRSSDSGFPRVTRLRTWFPVDDIRADGVCLVAHEADRAVASSVLRHLDGDTDEIKHLWVDPDARGLGLFASPSGGARSGRERAGEGQRPAGHPPRPDRGDRAVPQRRLH